MSSGTRDWKQVTSNRKKECCVARYGGLEEAEQFLRLRDTNKFDFALDVVFVSIELRLSNHGRSKPGGRKTSTVREFGIATFDTRYLRCRLWPLIAMRCIETRQFSTFHASPDFHDCDIAEFTECTFAETILASQENNPATLTKFLRIKDYESPDPNALRSIVIVRHSTNRNLNILQRLGIIFHDIVPWRTLARLETQPIATKMFRADSASLMANFKLSSLSEELKCPYKEHDLDNARNFATFTLHALLLLAIKSSESRHWVIFRGEILDVYE